MVIILVVTSANDVQKQKQFQKLEARKNDRDAEVIRNGTHEKISVFEVSVGDVMVVASGDIICVDGVFISGHGIINERIFTIVFNYLTLSHLSNVTSPLLLENQMQ